MTRSRRPADSGLTLVELMVATMITGLIAILTASLVIGVQRTNQENVARQDQIDAARVSVEAMARTLRAAVKPSQVVTGCSSACDDIEAFQQGNAFRVQFYANIDNENNSVGPRRVTYEVPLTGPTAGTLVETVQRPNAANPSGGVYQYCTLGSSGCASRVTTRTLARDVVTTGRPLLRYYDSEGREMTSPTTGSLSAAQLRSVLSVELTVTVTTGEGAKPMPTTYIQRVMMPNAQAVIKAGES